MSADLKNERTEIWRDLENISKRSLEVMSRAEQTSDYCHNSKAPSYLVTNDQYGVAFQMIKQLQAKGVKQRFITEITPENFEHCKELGKHVELRHLDGLKGNFGIVDGKEYGAAANIYDLISDGKMPIEFIYSNVKTFVEQQQYFFETLWSRAVPAALRIKEIEEGVPIERTEVIEGTENVIRKLTEGFAVIKESFDNCIDASCPSGYVSTKPVWDQCIQLYHRGIKLRFITEITEHNASYCKEIMKIAELRHLDKLRGNFGIADRRDYRGVADMVEGKPPTQAIRSTVKSFVDQQQYFFETLWNRAIPAELKITQLEEGVAPETVETFTDPAEIQHLAGKLVGSAKKELLIVFASTKELQRQQDKSADGFLAALRNRERDELGGTSREAVSKRLDIRITVPSGEGEEPNEKLRDVQIGNQPSGHGSAGVQTEIRFIDANLRTMVTVIVIDRIHSLVMEVNDDNSVHGKNEGSASRGSRGLAIYSNSKALVMSTVSMFELLWNHIELYEEIKLRDAAQREFINIAAHELRGPIQPILGLAEEIRARQPRLGKEGKFLGVILDSATSLQKLANNILDVARIENKSLRLQKTRFDLDELVTSVMQNFANELAHKKGVRIEFKPRDKHLSLYADKDKMNQVISNLISNAIKFTDQGTVSISAKKTSDKIEVSIKDTGRGIDQEVLPRLFTKFTTSSTGTSGTGLGLFISQKIVEAHGGHLYGTNNDTSEGGVRGATFTLILPNPS